MKNIRILKANSIKLFQTEIEALNAIADKNKSFARAGVTFGEPSWRAMLKAIAAGTLVVSIPGVRHERPAKIKKERKPFKAHPKYKARWWTPDDIGQMKSADVVKASGYTLEELEAGGLLVGGPDRNLTAAPPTWFGWQPKDEGGEA